MLSIIEHEGSFFGVELCQNSFNDHDALVKDYPAVRLCLLYFTFVNMLYQNYKKVELGDQLSLMWSPS